MALVIKSNVMSLNAQRNLTTSGGWLAQSLQCCPACYEGSVR